MPRTTETPYRSFWEYASLALATLTASLVAGGLAIAFERREAEGRFQEQAEAIHRIATQRLASTEAVVTTLVGLRHASDEIRPYQFVALASELLKTYPFIGSIADLALVADEERQAFVAEMRHSGFPQFTVLEQAGDGRLVPAEKRPRYMVLRWLEPLSPESTRLLGFDILSAPKLAQAVDRAVVSGEVVVADTIGMIGGEPCFLAFKAVYRGHGLPDSPAERWEQLSSLVTMHLSQDSLLGGIVEQRGGLAIAFDGTAGDDLDAEPAEIELRPLFGHGDFTFRRAIGIGGETFALSISRPFGLEAVRTHVVALAMLLPALLGVAAALTLRSRRRRLRQGRLDARSLMRNEQRFRDYAEIASDWFWSTDAALRFDYVSKPVSGITGLAIGDPLTRIAGSEAEPAIDAEGRSLSHCLEHGSAFRDARFRYVCASGTPHWWSLSGKPVLDEDGRFLCYRGTGRNISCEMEAADALMAAKDEAETGNRSKSQFLASMSHELRTPLNAIIGFSELMEKEVLGPMGRAEYVDYCKDIGDSGRHLLDLINDILDLSKIESGAASLVEDFVDLRQIAEASVTMVKGRAERDGIAIEIDLPERAPLVRGDNRKLRQVLVNLLANGVKFTDQGGRVLLRMAPPGAEGGLCLEIVDTGIGMEPADIPKALTPFQQVDSDLNRRYEGTGLGLPLSKALVEMHDGRLEIRSQPAAGTTVSIWLPPQRLCESSALAIVAPPTPKAAAMAPA